MKVKTFLTDTVNGLLMFGWLSVMVGGVNGEKVWKIEIVIC